MQCQSNLQSTSPEPICAYTWQYTRCHHETSVSYNEKQRTWNQSMVQQLTSEGNLRMRVRREVPAGDMARTMCSWSRTIDTKYAYSAVGLPSV